MVFSLFNTSGQGYCAEGVIVQILCDGWGRTTREAGLYVEREHSQENEPIDNYQP